MFVTLFQQSIDVGFLVAGASVVCNRTGFSGLGVAAFKVGAYAQEASLELVSDPHSWL